jgi:hypothetical protein
MGKTVQDGQMLIFRQGTQVFQKGAGGSIKGDVNQRFVLILGFLDEIQAENRRQRAGIVVPDDVVTDKQSTQLTVKLAYTRGNTYSFFKHENYSI